MDKICNIHVVYCVKFHNLWLQTQYYSSFVWYDGIHTKYALKEICKAYTARVKALLKRKRVQLHKVYLVTMPA